MSNDEPIQYRKKICLLGDSAVGKTSLIKRYVYNQFDDKYISTIGTNVSKKDMDVVVYGQNNQITNYDLTLAIWDIIGQKEQRTFNLNYFRNANGGLVVCDITRRETLDNLDIWTSSLFNIAGEVPLVFILNKYDLRNEAAFDIDDLRAIADRHNAQCFFTSARTGENVENAFYSLAEMIVTKSIIKDGDLISTKTITSEIIMEFCNNVGGLERGIPLIREIFKVAGVNLFNPTKEQLKIALPDLEQLLRDLRGEETAERVADKFNGLMVKLE